ncbi:hypothetical protein B0H11DRAFT_2219665 [Mycena galericulata]|nr:hypothetical protein B0H11DRAFT_2219665 [Mycena galericulata]
MRWREEVDLLEEEMRRTGEFLAWRSNWWKDCIDQRGLEDGAQREGETAYALRQAALLSGLRDSFLVKWGTLPELIRRGRVGEGFEREEWVDTEEDSEGEEEDEGSESGAGSEADPVPDSGGRPVRTTYLDV